MNWIKKTFYVLAASALLLTSCKKDDNAKENIKLGDKSGLLLVTFGSSYPAPQYTYTNFDKDIRSQIEKKYNYKPEDIQWGYTSTVILNELRKGEGHRTLKDSIFDRDTPEESLIKMAKKGYSKFVVQSLNVIPGEEFDEIGKAVERFKKDYPGVKVIIGRPLLDTEEDQNKVVDFMYNHFNNDQAINKENPMIFMGHGTPHKNNKIYGELKQKFQAKNQNVYLGTVEGTTSDQVKETKDANGNVTSSEKIGDGTTGIKQIVEALKSNKAQTIRLTPLMSIAGDHANNDMNGDTGANKSWREQLEHTGYETKSIEGILKGLGDYPEIRAIWISHLKTAIDEAKKKGIK